MAINPFNFLGGISGRIAGTLRELENNLLEQNQVLQEELRANDAAREQRKTADQDKQRASREAAERTKAVREAQSKLREAVKRRADAEKAQAPAALLSSLDAQVRKLQEAFEIAAAVPNPDALLPGDPFRPEPAERLEARRDLEAKIADLSTRLENPLPEDAAQQKSLEGLLRAYQARLEELHKAAPGDAARKDDPSASPSSRMEQQAAALRERIAQAQVQGLGDAQLTRMETQLDALLQGIRMAGESVSKNAEKGPTRSASERNAAQIAQLEKQIAELSKDPRNAERTERLSTQLYALQEAQRHASTAPASPSADFDVSYDAQQELAHLRAALDELGTGYELLADSAKLEDANRLRKRIAQLEKSLPPGATIRGSMVDVGAGVGVRPGEPGAAQDPKLQALLNRYYGESADFGDAKRFDPNLPRAQVTVAASTALAEEVASEFLTYLPGDENLPPEQKEKMDRLVQSATNELTAAFTKLAEENGGKAPSMEQAVAEAKESLSRQVLKSEDGAYAVLRDLRSLFNQGRREGTVSDQQYAKYELYLDNTFTGDLMSRIAKETDTGVKRDKEQIVQSLFSEALGYADRQIRRDQRLAGAGGRSTLDRLAGLSTNLSGSLGKPRS